MVHRRLTSIAAGAAAFAVAALLAAGPADAASTRVSISDFRWSKEPTIDLGEKVIWDWIGPDTAHSVTGQAPNATQWDSDFGISQPLHRGGDSYEVTFDQPGEYLFVCKLHSSVRGTVTVTDRPGDPNSDPGPQPPIEFDGTPPTIEELRLNGSVAGPKGKGLPLEAAFDERGTADAEYYRLVKRGKRTVKRYSGYNVWPIYIGYNTLRFGARTKTFKAKPGKYLALLRATDEHHNTSDPVRVRFEIKGKKKAKKNRKHRKNRKR